MGFIRDNLLTGATLLGVIAGNNMVGSIVDWMVLIAAHVRRVSGFITEVGG